MKYLAAFQAPKQRNLLFVPSVKHPRCVYLQLTGSTVSRGRYSLQLFVLTKAFIAKMQELTSFDCQEGDKWGPLETTTEMHTDYSVSQIIKQGQK